MANPVKSVRGIRDTLPPGSVVGRLGSTAGAAQAVGLADLVVALRKASPQMNNFQNPITPIEKALLADVVLNNTGNYFDGPKVSVGTSGVWLVFGTVTLDDTGANLGSLTGAGASFNVKLWDGTTIIASGRAFVAVAGGSVSVTLFGVINSPAGDLKVSVQDVSSSYGLIKFNASGSSKDSKIMAIQIA